MLEVEGSSTPHFEGILAIAGYEDQVVQHHVSLLIDAGLIRALELSDPSSPEGFWLQDPQLTWDGHEFLDKIRDPKIWKKTKEGAQVIGTWSISVLKEIAVSIAKQKAIEYGILIS